MICEAYAIMIADSSVRVSTSHVCLRQGILLLPLLGPIAFTWGKLVLVLALCYILFALGALVHQRWAWGLGLGVSLVTGLVVLSLMLTGAADLWSLLWLIVPVVLVCYLLSPRGRQDCRR